MKICFVCTGNTCRSPMAEGFMRYYLEKYKLEIEIMSRGIMVNEASPANLQAIEAMTIYDNDISTHRAKRLKQDEIDDDMIILVMTDSHLEYIKKHYIVKENQLYTLAGFVGEHEDIVDPFGMDQPNYNQCAEDIKGYVKKVAQKLNSQK